MFLPDAAKADGWPASLPISIQVRPASVDSNTLPYTSAPTILVPVTESSASSGASLTAAKVLPPSVLRMRPFSLVPMTVFASAGAKAMS